MHIIYGATYRDTRTGENAVLLGLKVSQTVIQYDSGAKSIPHAEFNEFFVDTGIHDHESFCCDEHDLHTMPHKGCILR